MCPVNPLWHKLYTRLTHIFAYHGDHAAGPHTVAHAHHAHVVRVLAPLHEELVTHEVGTVVDLEAAALHSDGVAAVEVGVQVGTVTHALMVTATEVSILEEDDLQRQNESTW